MNDDLKNSFKEAFLHEPSLDFSDQVGSRISRLPKKSTPEKSVDYVLIGILFFIVGLPIFTVIFAVFADFQSANFENYLSRNSWLVELSQLVQILLPYLIYLMAFGGVYFLSRLFSLRFNSNLT
jgi:ABC-type uncharacterized transport system fused permease/ATPase subunit